MRKGLIFIIVMLFNVLFIYGINSLNTLMAANDFMIYFKGKPEVIIDDNQKEEEQVIEDYKGESLEKIIYKMNKYFKETPLEGYEESIVNTSVKNGINPYLIGAIVLESTGCKYNCSVIFNECHNTYGVKGKPGCFGGSYRVFNSVEDSVKDLVKEIKNKFSEEENQVPNKMFDKYGKNAIWAFKVSKYMDELKAVK